MSSSLLEHGLWSDLVQIYRAAIRAHAFQFIYVPKEAPSEVTAISVGARELPPAHHTCVQCGCSTQTALMVPFVMTGNALKTK
jgi:hypothetical protein